MNRSLVAIIALSTALFSFIFTFSLTKDQLVASAVSAETISQNLVSTTTAATSTTPKIAYTSNPFPIEITKAKVSSLSSFGGSIYTILAKIARCESGNDPTAKNKTSSAKGLLQIIDGTWQSFSCEGNVYNPDDNMKCGVKIATLSGLHHWDESKACWMNPILSTAE